MLMRFGRLISPQLHPITVVESTKFRIFILEVASEIVGSDSSFRRLHWVDLSIAVGLVT